MKQHAIILTDKLTLGISACVMGCPVRYNNKGSDLLKAIGRERSDYKWCPVCPESMAGLGVPRDPIHISGDNGAAVWTGGAEVKNRRGYNVTDDVKYGAKVCLETLARANAVGFVYMDGSPSCGVYRTSLKKQKRGNPPGIFGSLLLEKGYFLIPGADLQSPLKWWDWRRRLLAFSWLKEFDILTKSDLYFAWHHLKFLSQELENTWAREMGRRLEAVSKKEVEVFVPIFKSEVLEVLRRPSTTARIINSLWKSYSFYRKNYNKTIPEINSPEFKRNITTIAKELILLERASIDDAFLLGSSPVIYREKRRLPQNYFDSLEEMDGRKDQI